jgi:hypothetical protein
MGISPPTPPGISVEPLRSDNPPLFVIVIALSIVGGLAGLVWHATAEIPESQYKQLQTQVNEYPSDALKQKISRAMSDDNIISYGEYAGIQSFIQSYRKRVDLGLEEPR